MMHRSISQKLSIVGRNYRFGRICDGTILMRAFSVSDSATKTYFKEQGLLDNQGMTVFNTLHELQEVACKVYGNNELFGTFSGETQQFEYLTYKQFGGKVEECRAVLKNLGKCSINRLYLYECLSCFFLSNFMIQLFLACVA
jgi:hypothetical protein